MTERTLKDLETATERQFAILRAIAAQPGLSPEQVRDALLAESGRRWGMATLYKDVAALKDRGLLDRARNRQGYYLAGAGYTDEEAQVLLNGLRIQAEDLGNPQARALYEKLLRRMGPSQQSKASLDLAIEGIANRPVVRTSGDDFSDLMNHLREPLLRGQKVGVKQQRTPWEPLKQTSARYVLYPLQFLYHDVAWYLLAEDVGAKRYVAMRLDRLHSAIDVHDDGERGCAIQAERQALARQVLRQGWGMAMPGHDLKGRLRTPCETFELRFAPEAAPFVAENHLRHDSQRTRKNPDGSVTFTVELPAEDPVVFQFRRWVLTWGKSVEVVGPAWFRERLASEQADIAALYARSAQDGASLMS